MPLSPLLLAAAAATAPAQPAAAPSPSPGAPSASLPPSPHLSAGRAAEAPVIDGKLDDAAWRGAPQTTSFTEKFPREGQRPLESTTLRVLYDDKNLYVAFDCVQVLAPLVRRLSRRDRQVESDWVSFDVDTRRDGTTAFEFYVNSAGVLADTIRFNDTDSSPDWDETWEAVTALTEHGWSAEFRIPLRALRFDSLPVQSWGLEARRYVSERHETDEWAYIPRSVAGEVSHYGKLDGLTGLRSGAPLELRPFVAGRLRRRDLADGQLASGYDQRLSAGLDLKWHPTQSMTLDLAVNPDFAQVEADQVVLNLTKFETYYPEKRPFFLEGIDTFTTPIQLVYTRRIGRAPDAPQLRPGEQLVDVPEPATIYGASKLTGSLGNRWSVGTLQALTARSAVDVQLPDGSRTRRVVEPLKSFSVLRLKRDLGDNAHVGFLATAVSHAEPAAGYPLDTGGQGGRPLTLCPNLSPNGNTVSLAQGSRCFNDAFVATLDSRWRSPSGMYVAGAQAGLSTLRNGPPRYVLDGTVLRPGDVGKTAFAYAAKEGGEHLRGYVEATYADRNFDPNDLGYSQRSNEYEAYGEIEYRTLDPWWATLETASRLQFLFIDNTRGLSIARRAALTTEGKLSNFWTYATNVHARGAHFDDREVGDGAALERAAQLGHDLDVKSDPTRAVSFSLHSSEDILRNGFILSASAGALLRALPQLDVELLPTASYTAGEPRYVGPGEVAGEYLFGRLDARSVGVTLRATYTFAPQLTLQSYAQLFLASGHYAGFTQFGADPAAARPAVRLADLRPGPSPAANPDFEQGVLNVNVVLRWEYRLGSLLYVVYTRSQVPNTVTLAPGDRALLDPGAAGRAPASDVILVKVSYWWGGA